MPKRKSLTTSATAKVRTADKHAVKFSKAVRDAMRLADRYDIQVDEYVLPVPHMDTPAPTADSQYPFEQMAYSRL